MADYSGAVLTRGAFPLSTTIPLRPLLPVAGAPRLAPLYDVSSVLPREHVNPYFAQRIAGRKRRPGEIAARHLDVLSREAGFRPADVRLRVCALIDRIVARRIEVTDAVCALPGVAPGYVEQVAGTCRAKRAADRRTSEIDPAHPPLEGKRGL